MLPAFWHPAWTAALANHLWQSTVVALLAWVLSWALRRNQARTRYWVWLIASVKFLLPFSILIWAGEALRPVYTAPIPQPAFAVMTQITEPFHQTVPLVAVKFSPEASSPARRPIRPLPLLCLTVWLGGFLAVAFSWIRSWQQIRAAVRAASPSGVLGEIPVLSSPRLLEPGVFGILHPVLVLPKDIATRISAQQLRAVLAHEMCHIRRRDNLTAAIHAVVEATFWFHPAVWWIKTRLLEEREWACDEAVLQSGNEAEPYAESILKVCKFSLESPLSCVSAATGADLKMRIARIMAGKVGNKLGLGRKLLIGAAGIAAVGTPVVFGLMHKAPAGAGLENSTRGIVDTWQGAVHIKNSLWLQGQKGKGQGEKEIILRAALKISKADTGGYKAIFYSIDRNPGGVPVSRITFDGATVKIWVAVIDGSYEGKLSPDGQMIRGIWSQGPTPLPLDFTRATPETKWTIPRGPTPLPPMDENASPIFEAATIKPSSPDEASKGFFASGGRRFYVVNESLANMISYTYDIHSKLILRAPAWVVSDRYDIEGQAGGDGAPSLKQWKTMLQKLLANRYKLSFHRETREVPVYVLSATTSGIKLAESPENANQLPHLMFHEGLGNLLCTNATIDDLAGVLQQAVLDRPVLNQTGLTGRYDFTLKWKPDDSQFVGLRAKIFPDPKSADGFPPLPQAMQQQIGVKLADGRATVEVIVIDGVGKPVEN